MGAVTKTMPLAKCLACQHIFITSREPTEADRCPNCAAPLLSTNQEDVEAAIAEAKKSELDTST